MPKMLSRLAAILSLIAVAAPLRAWAQPIPAGLPPLTLAHLGALHPLQGSVLPATAHARRLGALPAGRTLSVSLMLRVRDQQALDQFVRSVYDPHSSQYHHFLTTQQFAERFAPSASDRAVITTWLRRQGLHVTGATRNGLLIQAAGSVNRVERAFGTSLAEYNGRQGHFFANMRPIQLPAALAPRVAAVMGLNDGIRAQPLGLGHVHPLARPHDQSWDGYYPADLVAAYDLSTLRARVDGSGQTIALAELDDYNQGNISAYDSRFNISAPTPERIAVPYNGRKAKMGDGETEVELDMEVTQAIAPGAQLLVYESPNDINALVIQIDAMVSDNKSSILSMSWGVPETTVNKDYVASENEVIEEAATQGVSVLAASGDNGAYADSNQPNTLTVQTPSDDPWLTAVGGTALNFDGTSYQGEQSWGDTSDNSGSGGGLSSFFREPYYQQGPGVQNSYSNGGREVPDVSANGDPNTGYAIYTYDTSSKKTGWQVWGGTSAAAPLWASYVALLDDYLNQKLGFLNPLLYDLGQKSSTFSYSPFHDVTQGNNLYYPATPGWDFATGWGSMDGVAFLNDIIDLENAGPLPTPNLPLSYGVLARWESVGGDLNRPALKQSRAGHKVQIDLYMRVFSANPGLPVTFAYTVKRGGSVIKQYHSSGALASSKPAGIYNFPVTLTPHRPGTYTFIGLATVAGQSERASATLHVTK
ncbi:MAG TPA: S53 family peptidase [Chloroflexota bacterium]|nr:S53 family peptidase [Chloroflexota bacterium]